MTSRGAKLLKLVGVEFSNQTQSGIDHNELEFCRQDARQVLANGDLSVAPLDVLPDNDIDQATINITRGIDHNELEFCRQDARQVLDDGDLGVAPLDVLPDNDIDQATINITRVRKRLFEEDSEKTPPYSTLEEDHISPCTSLNTYQISPCTLLDTDQNSPRPFLVKDQNSSVAKLCARIEKSLSLLRKAKTGVVGDKSRSALRRKLRRIKRLEDALSRLKHGSGLDEENLQLDAIAAASSVQAELDNGTTTLSETNEHQTEIAVLEERQTQIQTNPIQTKSAIRRKNKCLYCELTPRDYAEHIERKHKDTSEGKQLIEISKQDLPTKIKSQMKRKITRSMTKKSNDIINDRILKDYEERKTETLQLITVKTLSKKNADLKNTIKCKHCNGIYNKKKLWIHLKNSCDAFKSRIGPQTHELQTPTQTHQTTIISRNNAAPILNSTNASNVLKNEVLISMRKDELYETAIRDPLIMKYGSNFLISRREEKDRNYVARECRDLARLLMEIKKVDDTVTCLDQCMSPAYFETFIQACLNLCGYEEHTGTIKVSSVPYRILPAIKNATKIAKGEAICRMYLLNEKNQEDIISRYNHFLEMIDAHWSSRIGRISVKSRKAQIASSLKKMPLQEDIVKVCEHITSNYRPLLHKLMNSTPKEQVYDALLMNLVVHIMCLMRRRPVAFKMAIMKNYELMDVTNDIDDMAKQAGLTKEEIEQCRKFSIFYVQSKNCEVVPIALTPLMREALDGLIAARRLLGITSIKLFVTSQNKLVNASYSLEKVKKKLPLKKPLDLTANGLRHHAATFSKLHSTNPRYQDYLASALGHSLLIHKKNYELPMSILQKLVVMPTLHKMTSDPQTKQQTTKPQSKKPSTCISDSKEESGPDTIENETCDTSSSESLSDKETGIKRSNTISRSRWTAKQRRLVFNEFGEELVAGTCPPRSRVVLFYNKYRQILNRNEKSVYTYIHNIANKKQRIYTPERKQIKSKNVVSSS